MQLTFIKARDMSVSQVPINSQTSFLVMYVYTAGSMCKREPNNSTEPYSSTEHSGCQKLFFFLISSGILENLQHAGWAECVNCFKSRILPVARTWESSTKTHPVRRLAHCWEKGSPLPDNGHSVKTALLLWQPFICSL